MQQPRWSYSRAYRVVYAISTVSVLILQFVYDRLSGDGSSFILGQFAYWSICFLPSALVISLVSGLILTGSYAIVSYFGMRLSGSEPGLRDVNSARNGGLYIILCSIVFCYSKSIGQPYSQALLAALFITPFLALGLVVVYALLRFFIAAVGEIKILP